MTEPVPSYAYVVRSTGSEIYLQATSYHFDHANRLVVKNEDEVVGLFREWTAIYRQKVPPNRLVVA